jgi:hypothetical protein
MHLSEDVKKQVSKKESLVEPSLLRAARQIYRTYCQLHSRLNKTPIGVAIDGKTHRGQLLFTKRPILLPGERFVSLKQLEAEAS